MSSVQSRVDAANLQALARLRAAQRRERQRRQARGIRAPRSEADETYRQEHDRAALDAARRHLRGY